MGLMGKIAAREMATTSTATSRRCPGVLSSACTGEVVGAYALDFGGGQRRVHALDERCLDVATRLGYDPRPVPMWRRQDLAKDLTGRVA